MNSQFTAHVSWGVDKVSFPLSKALTGIGCSPDNEIIVPARFASEMHAHLRLDNGTVTCEALGDGVMLKYQGKRCLSCRLSPGETVEIGKVSVRLELSGQSWTAESAVGNRLADGFGAIVETVGKLLDGGEVDPALERILELSVSIFDCERGMIFEQDANSGFVPRMTVPSSSKGQSWSATVVTLAAKKRSCMVFHDIGDDTELFNQESIKTSNIRSFLAGPLMAGPDELSGILVLDSRRKGRKFTESESKLFEYLVALASMLLGEIRRRRKLEEETEALKKQLEAALHGDMIYGCESMRKAAALTAKAGAAEVGVLITGESGTGKELIARAIHRRSSRASAPFVAVNCASFQHNLLESELFGHERGAFTGAVTAKRGLVQAADKGILFLDEIGEMEQSLQAKLLRFIQDGTFMPVGSTVEIRADVRVVAATNRDIEKMIQEGKFRQDLFFRINVVRIHLPPLKQRDQDALLLARYFLIRHARRLRPSENEIPRLSPSAEQSILSFDWPGNVRQLENVIQQALLMCDGKTITEEDLGISRTDNLLLKTGREIADKERISKALALSAGNLSNASLLLGIDRKVLRDLLKRYNFDKMSFIEPD